MKCLNCDKEAAKGRKLCDKCRKAQQRGNVPKVSPKAELSPNVPKKMSPECPRLNEQPAVNSKLPLNYGLENCTCKHCESNRINGNKLVVNHTGQQLPGQVNRVSLPGDIDYDGCMIQVDGVWQQKFKDEPLDNSQPAIAQRNAETRERLRTTPIEQLIKSGCFIPKWRYSQDKMYMV